MTADLYIARATRAHLDALLRLEQASFSGDRLSRRSLRRFLSSEHSVFLVALAGEDCLGYLLINFHRGTRLARLYSLAVDPAARGRGVARKLMAAGEAEASRRGAFYLRLEVSQSNEAAMTLYRSLGFRQFDLVEDYYEDHSNALRMQKRIRHLDQDAVHTALPWYRQSTPFTCGPSALMIAMAGLDKNYSPSFAEELRLWREATTIYMTSGHGGCHPLGLALAAQARGFEAQVWLNQETPLFLDGVRSDAKKNVMSTVHDDFVEQCKAVGIVLNYADIDQQTLVNACAEGAVPLVLISTWRLDGKKAPHWVVVSGYDDQCFYLHDPDVDEKQQDEVDCQYLPIAREDFEPMSVFGSQRLRTAVLVRRPSETM